MCSAAAGSAGGSGERGGHAGGHAMATCLLRAARANAPGDVGGSELGVGVADVFIILACILAWIVAALAQHEA